ncbi:GNAT family N-acetyltransferase [Streptomyces flavofungini]|uniref:GNAT family N-acetyltransferase n=1 Tax=Streptomyces flavofungini TaxID=68200 RepID=A0ABS0X1W0_9ACTN|nr:GNAT family N-acetyltransferase [Streptomyces flavofungini]MBJ3807178.1 GNAT family N-acetyltransferase [Streptomyces flavofungini]
MGNQMAALAGELGELLVDAVDGGASVGFLAGLDRESAADWWRGRAADVTAGRVATWVVRANGGEGVGDAGRVIGTVSLAFAAKPNARHRAELVKLLVHREARGRGLGRSLLALAEREAARAGVTLLLLDTETDSPAETLYASAGWTRTGVVPDHAADPAGMLRPTTFLYKSLVQGPDRTLDEPCRA